MTRYRKIVKTLIGREQGEGVGALVRRGIGSYELRNFDPFLLMDEFMTVAPGGFPDHPHRGFETVTYMLEGAFEHEDFGGHRGLIKAGDLQWMSAGKGIVHAEMPVSEEPMNRGLQLWINLSAKDKMCDPKYQELLDNDIPRAESLDRKVRVKVIAGEALGVTSKVITKTRTIYLDFELDPGASICQPIPSDYNAFIYTLSGIISLHDDDDDDDDDTKNESSYQTPKVNPSSTVILGPGDSVLVQNASDHVSRFVLIAGIPIGEPIVQRGPFVMNSMDEIEKAFSDYANSENGFERAREWSSEIGKRSIK